MIDQVLQASHKQLVAYQSNYLFAGCPLDQLAVIVQPVNMLSLKI